MTSSGVPLTQPASGSPAPRSPSPALPSLPFPPVPSFSPPPRPSQSAPSPSSPVNRPSTGPVPPFTPSGRSSYFLDAPSRYGSASARTYANNDLRESSGAELGYTTTTNDNNNSNGNNGGGLGAVHDNRDTYNRNDNTLRNSDHRTTSSFTASTEKAAMLIDQAAPGVFQVDFGHGHGHGRGNSQTSGNIRGHGQGYDDGRTSDSRFQYHLGNQHHTSVSAPLQAFTQDKLGAVAEGIWQGVNGGFAGGGGGGRGGGGGGAVDMDIDDDNVGIPYLPRTVQERLQPTINHAMEEEAKYAKRAKITAYALNCAIGLQVLLSALITALSAVTTGRNTQIMTSILGGAGTVVASYLARARGSNEPELSIARTKDLQRFVRRCDAFVQDHGMETGFEGDISGEEAGGGDGAKGGDGEGEGEGKSGRAKVLDLKRARELDDRIREFRIELEHLLGNGNGERRLAPPV